MLRFNNLVLEIMFLRYEIRCTSKSKVKIEFSGHFIIFCKITDNMGFQTYKFVILNTFGFDNWHKLLLKITFQKKLIDFLSLLINKTITNKSNIKMGLRQKLQHKSF